MLGWVCWLLCVSLSSSLPIFKVFDAFLEKQCKCLYNPPPSKEKPWRWALSPEACCSDPNAVSCDGIPCGAPECDCLIDGHYVRKLESECCLIKGATKCGIEDCPKVKEDQQLDNIESSKKKEKSESENPFQKKDKALTLHTESQSPFSDDDDGNHKEKVKIRENPFLKKDKSLQLGGEDEQDNGKEIDKVKKTRNRGFQHDNEQDNINDQQDITNKIINNPWLRMDKAAKEERSIGTTNEAPKKKRVWRPLQIEKEEEHGIDPDKLPSPIIVTDEEEEILHSNMLLTRAEKIDHEVTQLLKELPPEKKCRLLELELLNVKCTDRDDKGLEALRQATFHLIRLAAGQGTLKGIVFATVDTIETCERLCAGGDGCFDKSSKIMYVCVPGPDQIKTGKFVHLNAMLDIIFYEVHNAVGYPLYRELVLDFQKTPGNAKQEKKGFPPTLKWYGEQEAIIECSLTLQYGLAISSIVSTHGDYELTARGLAQLDYLKKKHLLSHPELIVDMIKRKHAADAQEFTSRSLSTAEMYMYSKVEQVKYHEMLTYLGTFFPELFTLRNELRDGDSRQEVNDIIENVWFSPVAQIRPLRYVHLIKVLISNNYPVPAELIFSPYMEKVARQECLKFEQCGLGKLVDYKIPPIPDRVVHVFEESAECLKLGTVIVPTKKLGQGTVGQAYLLETGSVMKLMDKTLECSKCDNEKAGFTHLSILAEEGYPFFVGQAIINDNILAHAGIKSVWTCKCDTFKKFDIFRETLPEHWGPNDEIQVTMMAAFDASLDKMEIRPEQKKPLLLQLLFASAFAWKRFGYIQGDGIPENFGWKRARSQQEKKPLCLVIEGIVGDQSVTKYFLIDTETVGFIQLFDFDKTSFNKFSESYALSKLTPVLHKLGGNVVPDEKSAKAMNLAVKEVVSFESFQEFLFSGYFADLMVDELSDEWNIFQVKL